VSLSQHDRYESPDHDSRSDADRKPGPLSTQALLSAPSRDVVWTLVGGARLFLPATSRSTMMAIVFDVPFIDCDEPASGP
jgi:hypothetical protein